MSATVLGALMMVTGAVVMNLGFVLQKLGVSSFPERKAVRPGQSRVRVFLTHPVWVAGIFLNVVGVALCILAVGFAPYTLVAPLRAAGLPALSIFSYMILRERLSGLEGLGILLVVLCTAALGVLGAGRGTLGTFDEFDERVFSLMPNLLTASLLLMASLLWLLHWRRGHPDAHLVFGTWGGVTAAVGLVYSKGFTLGVLEGVSPLLESPQGVLTLVLSQFGVLTLIGSQVGYRTARAVIMVPIINTLGLAIPILYGAAFLGEWSGLSGGVIALQSVCLCLLSVAVAILSYSGEVSGRARQSGNPGDTSAGVPERSGRQPTSP